MHSKTASISKIDLPIFFYENKYLGVRLIWLFEYEKIAVFAGRVRSKLDACNRKQEQFEMVLDQLMPYIDEDEWNLCFDEYGKMRYKHVETGEIREFS